MKKVIVSKKFTIQLRDVVKGLLMAALTPAVFIVQSSLDAGHLELNWKQIGMAALAGAGAYLVKQFFSEPKVITTYDNNAHAQSVAQDLKDGQS